jgi:hypothetical protein
VVGRKLHGSISMCRFSIDSYVCAVGVSVNGNNTTNYLDLSTELKIPIRKTLNIIYTTKSIIINKNMGDF